MKDIEQKIREHIEAHRVAGLSDEHLIKTLAALVREEVRGIGEEIHKYDERTVKTDEVGRVHNVISVPVQAIDSVISRYCGESEGKDE